MAKAMEMTEEEFERRQQWTHVAAKVAERTVIAKFILERATIAFSIGQDEVAHELRDLSQKIILEGAADQRELEKFIIEDRKRRGSVAG